MSKSTDIELAIATGVSTLDGADVVEAEICLAPDPLDPEPLGGCDEGLCEEITEESAGVTETATCAGIKTRCIARLRNYPYRMAVINARNSRHGLQLAQKCRNDVINATYYNGRIVVCCAPCILCRAR